eukprot:g14099.t1 g14099   contig9:1156000-1157026(-)
MHEHNELRTLRQQLAKSEQANKILQLEIAVSRDALMVQNKKYDDFCAEIKQVNADHSLAIESLQRELHVAKCESDMLPMYEERINALLDELKSKDTEIKWLNDEIAEVRDYFKNQVNALLWENDDSAPTEEVEVSGVNESSIDETEDCSVASSKEYSVASSKDEGTESAQRMHRFGLGTMRKVIREAREIPSISAKIASKEAAEVAKVQATPHPNSADDEAPVGTTSKEKEDSSDDMSKEENVSVASKDVASVDANKEVAASSSGCDNFSLALSGNDVEKGLDDTHHG